jgi:hypothetical protein
MLDRKSTQDGITIDRLMEGERKMSVKMQEESKMNPARIGQSSEMKSPFNTAADVKNPVRSWEDAKNSASASGSTSGEKNDRAEELNKLVEEFLLAAEGTKVEDVLRKLQEMGLNIEDVANGMEQPIIPNIVA